MTKYLAAALHFLSNIHVAPRAGWDGGENIFLSFIRFPVVGGEVQHHLGDPAVHPGPRPQHPGRVPPVRRPEDVNIDHQSDIEFSSVQRH